MNSHCTDDNDEVVGSAEAETTTRETVIEAREMPEVADIAPKEDAPAAPSVQPSRRGMLTGSALRALGVATAPLWLPKPKAHAAAGGPHHTLVIVFLRGGCDGLSIVAPRGLTSGTDSFYVTERQTPGGGPQLAIPLPSGSNGVVGLVDPSTTTRLPWMLSEGAAAANTMFSARDLVFVHGVGMPVVNNGSHFYSQDFMEDGTEVGSVSDGQGWAGRAMQPGTSTQAWRGMAYGKLLQRTLFGAPSTISIPDPTNYDLNGLSSSLALRKLGLEFLFNVSDDPLKTIAADSLETIDKLATSGIFPGPTPPQAYPATPFGTRMSNVAQLVRATADATIDVAVETVMLDYGDWDNHINIGPNPTGSAATEQMHLRTKDVFDTLESFYLDMKSNASTANYTVVLMTEFGRRITANATAGVDHGKGSLMVVMGNLGVVDGGRVLTMLPNPTPGLGGVTPGWNGLASHNVLQDGTTNSYNLLDTIDYRRVLGEILEKRLGLSTSQVQACFPGYAYASTPDMAPIGVLL